MSEKRGGSVELGCACLPGDWQREIGPIPTRKEIGLPEDTFIFASFNNSYKLNEKIVSCWMEILKRVPSSLLWLVDDNPWATSNIKAYARSQGVSEGRLYFSSRVLPADYRARMKLADLFLDNAPSNAGSTASDVVWMGLPMLTISGRTFVSRMAGALLQYADVPELIANSYEDYIERAVFFAANANEFAQTRNRMLDFKNGKGNTFAADFVRSLEMRYAEIHAERTNVVNVAAVKSPIKKKIQNRHQNTFTLLIEGWRNINHSFAMVNQHQIIALAKIRGIQLRHRDYPFYLTHWQQTREGSGFTDEKLDLINGLQDCTYEGADVVYRIAAPIPPPVQNIKNLTFMVTELGLDKKSFLDPKFPISSYTDGGNLIITPSTWSRNRLVDYGFDPDGIRIIPHAVDKNTFAPLSQQERKTQRSVLGIKEDEIIVLNVGAPLWNKGIDILLKTVAQAIKAGKKIRLILKNNKDLYGLDLAPMLQLVNAEVPGILTEEFINSIFTIDNSFSLSQLRTLYGISDLYVSPYRAEGFNLPVLEAMACGTPVVVTEGGATDDFVGNRNAEKIPAIRRLLEDSQKNVIGSYLEPDSQALLEILLRATPKSVNDLRSSLDLTLITWAEVALNLVDLAKQR